ncbi:TraR/DksA C4-type zinc finger protein [uncultured Porticoccus sp.]|jgi:DnaK suppressor protein|uniref:TraR/DksA family transcriptional regulator n=1 Tax=uncultured Porticoccus sp. TaxID=1256050 RepID=UPI0030D81997|tara:strand:+ start:784 stop:1104 length:321 start_codon:yes stop_codon:yes gene_type:complete
MTPELQAIKQRLHTRQTELTDRLSNLKTDISQAHSRDWEEQAQERENDEVVEALGNEARQELSLVNRALERIQSGTYNLCSQCGGEIALERLRAVPYTNLCIACAT